MKNDTNTSAGNGKSGALPTRQPNQDNAGASYSNRESGPAGPSKGNLVDTSPRTQSPSPVTGDMGDLHNK